MNKSPKLQLIEVDEIQVIPNPRKKMNKEADAELVVSIKEQGLLHPVGVNKVGNDYHLIFGQRRFQAHKTGKIGKIEAKVWEDLNDKEIAELQITENLHREDIHPMEEATAFNDLMVTDDKHTAKDIADRVGKSESYVHARIKLNDLIPEFKKAFLEDKMNLASALRLTVLPADIQKDVYKQLGKRTHIEISQWNINHYTCNLKDAPFSIKDAKLLPKAGACTTCIHNTAADTLLFPEASNDARCTLRSCFDEKKDIAFKNKIQKALKDPNVNLYFTDTANEAKYRAMFPEAEEKLHSSATWTQAYEPNEPEEPVFSDYEERLDDELYDSREDMIAEYNEDVEYYKTDLLEYQNDKLEFTEGLQHGSIKKAFIIDGYQQGKTILIRKKGTGASSISSGNAKEIQERIKSGNFSKSDIESEINRLQNAEERKKELDAEKIYPQIYTALDECRTYTENAAPFDRAEKVAMAVFIADLRQYHLSDEIEAITGKNPEEEDINYFEHINGLSDEDLDRFYHRVSRLVLLHELRPTKGSRVGNENRPLESCIAGIAGSYIADEVEQICKVQDDAREKRQTTLDKKVKKLQALEQKKVIAG